MRATGGSTRAYAVKAGADEFEPRRFVLAARKTMYGGKHVAAGDRIFLFASGARGLVARGIVIDAEPVPLAAGRARQTPRVTVTIDRGDTATRPIGRAELARFSDWADGRPETELNFKFYRQATEKLVGISDATAAFLDTLF